MNPINIVCATDGKYVPYCGVTSNDCRPIHPNPASAAYCFSKRGAVSQNVRPCREG